MIAFFFITFALCVLWGIGMGFSFAAWLVAYDVPEFRAMVRGRRRRRRNEKMINLDRQINHTR